MTRAARVFPVCVPVVRALSLILALLALPLCAAADDPGALLDTTALPPGTLAEGLQGWRITYATTIDDATPRPPSPPSSRPIRSPTDRCPSSPGRMARPALSRAACPRAFPIPRPASRR